MIARGRKPSQGARGAVVYPAKRDWWVTLFVVPASFLLVGMGTFAAYEAAAGAIPAVPGLPVGLAVAALGVVMLWMFNGTSYAIEPPYLVCRLGPFRWRVPLDAIVEAEATDGFRLVMGMSLAWSLSMVHVRYRKKSGRMASPVSISPQDRDAFLAELARAVPGLKVAR
jgi:hypothetical protein